MICQLQWTFDPVSLAALVAAGYDTQAVQQAALGGGWTELTRTHLRPALAAGVEQYCYEVGAVTLPAAADLRAVPCRTSDGATETPCTAFTVARRGYCTLAEVRAEGYGAGAYPDARVQDAIDQATIAIDRVCGQRFDAHYGRLALDIDPAAAVLWLREPCCALWRAWYADTEIAPADLTVYNRHLTQGLNTPDDRRNPRIERAGAWAAGRQVLCLEGVFGFTDLDGTPGTTLAGGQIPLTYGSTPADIRRACLLLVAARLPALAAGALPAALQSRVTAMTTRDQSITFAASAAAGGSTGVADADLLLQAFHAPIGVGVI
jgi:hypothetical protein